MNRRKPRVLWVTNLAAPYRIPVWRALADHVNLRVRLLADDESGRGWSSAEGQGLDLARWPTWCWSRDELYLYALRQSVSAEIAGADCVVLGGWDSPAHWQVRWAAHRRGVPVVIFYESTLESRHHSGGPIHYLRGRMLRSADLVVVPGESARLAALRDGVPDSRIAIIHNVVDVARYRGQHRPGDGGGHRFGFVGRMVDRKNVPSLLRAFAEIRAADDTLLLVGDGPARRGAQELASGLGLGDKVTWTGSLSGAALLEAQGRIDTLVHPATEEVWGYVVEESLAVGSHVVVSDRCGVARSVGGMHGVYICDTSPRGVATAMQTSRGRWQGPVECPVMEKWTPEAAGDHWLSAVRRAVGTGLGSSA